MNDPNDGDLLPDHVETDTYLRATHRSLAERLAAELSLEDGLTAILHGDSSASGQEPVSDRAGQAAAVALLGLRIQARASAIASDRAIGRTRRLAEDLDGLHALDLDRARDFDRARVLELLSDRKHGVIEAMSELRIEVANLSQYLARARGLNSALDLVPALDSAWDNANKLAKDLDRVLDLILARPRALARALARAFDSIRALARDLDRARALARDLDRAVDRMPVDASGADLSRLDVRNLDTLRGVTWTSQTKWPPGIADQVRANSVEIAEGLYEIRPGGKAQDPGMIVNGV